VWEALKSVWEDIKNLFDLLINAREYVGKVVDYISKADFEKLKLQAKTALHNGLMLLSDEPLIYLYAMAAITWVQLQPPMVIAELAGGVLLEVILNVVIGMVLTGGAGLAVRIGVKATRMLRTETTILRLSRAMRALIDLDTGLAGHVDKVKPLVAHGQVVVNSSKKTDVRIHSPLQSIDIKQPDAIVLTRKPARKVTVTQSEKTPDAPKQATNPDDKPRRQAR
jgi:hypothetical protein